MSNSLAKVHPELVSEWAERNFPLTPDDITYGSNKRVWWKGSCGHEWQASVKARSKGEGCPICSGARVVAGINDFATINPRLVSEWSEKNTIKPTEVTVGSHKKVIWKCEHGHEWTATVKSRTINNTGCPYCSHNKVLAGFNDLASQFPQIAAEWSDRNYPLLPTIVTAFANSKAWWKCKDCGHEWYTLISTRSGGSKCPYCSGYTLLKGFNDLATTHPQIAEEWSEKNFPLTPETVNHKSRLNVWWRCKTCGYEWKSVINARVKGTVCPVCADRAVLAGYNDLATTDKKILIPILTAFILVFAVSAGFIIKHYTESAKQEALYDSLAEIVETEPDENVEPAEPIQYTETKTILPEYTELFTQNSDMVGWITVEDTKINYPVMQSKNEPNFYLKHGFDKAYTDYGCPYVQENCDVLEPSDNLIIYGHHMNDGSMFAGLMKFTDNQC